LESEQGEAARGAADGDREGAHRHAMELESQSMEAEYALVARRNWKFHAVMAACGTSQASRLCAHLCEVRFHAHSS
jgi:hypothetical protein